MANSRAWLARVLVACTVSALGFGLGYPIASSLITAGAAIELILTALVATIFSFGFFFPASTACALGVVGIVNVEIFAAGMTVGSVELALLAATPGLSYCMIRERAHLPGYVKVWLAAIALGAVLPVIVTAGRIAEVNWGALRWICITILIGSILALVRSCRLRVEAAQISLVIGGLIAALLGISQQLGFTQIVGTPSLAGRPDSTFNWYSNYTHLLALAALVGMGLLLGGRLKRGPRVAVVVAVPVMLFQVVIGLSRGAVLALIAGFIYIAVVMAARPRNAIRVGLLGGLVILLVLVFAPSDSVGLLTERLTTAQGEDNFRNSLQVAGWLTAAQNPLGIGLGQFDDYLIQNGGLGALAALAHPHLLVTALIAEIGLLGCIAMMALLVMCLIPGGRARKTAPSPTLGAAAAIAAFVAQGFVDYFFYETANLIAVGLLVGVALSAAGRADGSLPATAVTRTYEKPANERGRA